MSRAWYVYNGTGNVTNSTSYIYNSYAFPPYSPLNCDSGTPVICAVYAPFSEAALPYPLGPLSFSLQVYIGDAISSSYAQPRGGGNKRYVYTRIPE